MKFSSSHHIKQDMFSFYSHCHAAAALVVAVCTATLGIGKDPGLSNLLTSVEKCFSLSFGVAKMKFHYCCPLGKYF